MLVNQVWMHNRTQALYQVIGIGPLRQHDGQWSEEMLVACRSLSGNVFYLYDSDFRKSFHREEPPKWFDID